MCPACITRHLSLTHSDCKEQPRGPQHPTGQGLLKVGVQGGVWRSWQRLGLAVPPIAHSHQLLVSGPAHQLAGMLGPGCLGCPARKRQPLGGWWAEERTEEGQEGEDARLWREARGPPSAHSGARTGCSTSRASGASYGQSMRGGRWGWCPGGSLSLRSKHPATGILDPRGRRSEVCGHKRAPRPHLAGSQGLRPAVELCLGGGLGAGTESGAWDAATCVHPQARAPSTL